MQFLTGLIHWPQKLKTKKANVKEYNNLLFFYTLIVGDQQLMLFSTTKYLHENSINAQHFVYRSS